MTLTWKKPPKNKRKICRDYLDCDRLSRPLRGYEVAFISEDLYDVGLAVLIVRTKIDARTAMKYRLDTGIRVRPGSIYKTIIFSPPGPDSLDIDPIIPRKVTDTTINPDALTEIKEYASKAAGVARRKYSQRRNNPSREAIGGLFIAGLIGYARS